MKPGPLSDCNEVGNPKQGIMSLSNDWVTSEDFSEVAGKASTHPEKVSTRVSKYRVFLMGACM